MKKNNKIFRKFLCFIIIFILSFSLCTIKVWADFYGSDWSDSDWDTGYDYDYDSSWDSDYSSWDDDDYYYSSSGYSGGGSYSSGSARGAFVSFIVMLIIFYVIISIATKNSRNKYSRTNYLNRNYGYRNNYPNINYINGNNNRYNTIRRDYRKTVTRTYENPLAAITTEKAQTVEKQILAVDELFSREEFESWVKQLAGVVGYEINELADLLKALEDRVEFFNEVGCRVSDHALDVVHYAPATYEEANAIFHKGMNHEAISSLEEDKYKGYILMHVGRLYHKYGWVQQYHIGALRNNSKSMLAKIGPDTGFDAIEDQNYMAKLSALMGALDGEGALPKTILYCLNPRDNYALTVLSGCFQKEGVKGYVQVGTAWWFLDQQDGMRQNFETLMQVGLIAQSVGMLTDSRSFLAYPRHEYYRRILCQMLGELVESGQYPAEEVETLGQIVENICYNNAKEFFGF